MGRQVVCKPGVDMKNLSLSQCEQIVQKLVSSTKWLQDHGLKKNKLELFQILPAIGFRLSDDYDYSLRKPISSKYGGGLFTRVFRRDGKTYNITCCKEKLQQLENQLRQAVSLYRQRLNWLTTGSRRIFGIIEEKNISVVLDIRNVPPQKFDQYRAAFEKVLREQVSCTAKFNLIRAAEDVVLYHPECVLTSPDTVEDAVCWLWHLDQFAEVSNTDTCNALLLALSDQNIEAVYLFTEGSSTDSCQQILREKILGNSHSLPVHVISFNCTSSYSASYLKELANVTGGKFHACGITMELDTYEPVTSLDVEISQANVILKKKTCGGLPPGCGLREDVILIFEELEQARNTLAQIQMLINSIPAIKQESEKQCEVEVQGAEFPGRNEAYMSSTEWLKNHGIDACRLGIHNILAGAAFEHKDGVIRVKHPPTSNHQTNAVSHEKLINARYCNMFPIVQWKNGQIMHVRVTPEMHRLYEERMQMALDVMQQRLKWLNQGSRALFGTLLEDHLYILLDTSSSMEPKLQFVKEKLFVLMQEQLRHKLKFNIISFNSQVTMWKDKLAEVSETNLQNAWKWIQDLTCSGSTNTYSALQMALADPHMQAVYLLTDGRPDQPPRSILAQILTHPSVPIHTIAFNCYDLEANQFLMELAKQTGGRYHCYCNDEDDALWQSEDISLLKDEIQLGIQNLETIAQLRDECMLLSWQREIDKLKHCSRNHPLSYGDRISTVPPLDPKDLYRPLSDTQNKHSFASFPPHRPATSLSLHASRRPLTTRKLVCGGGARRQQHYRSCGEEWFLPETRELFDRQTRRVRGLTAKCRKQSSRPKSSRKHILSSRSTVKQWLNRNSLKARQLTVLDALSPTFVPHRVIYVPILNKHVLAEVFDEILPLAYVSGRKKKEIMLVNPKEVDLKAYEKKVSKMIEYYKRYLDQIVWNSLPKEIRDDLDGEEPLSFSHNRSTVIKLLKLTVDWPVLKDDIGLLEKEIEKGVKYVQQSQSLRCDFSSDEESESESCSTDRSDANLEKSSAKLSTDAVDSDEK